MRDRIRRRLTYANVMSTIAVFAVLGGTSYAAITITGAQVKDGSLTGADIRNASLTPVDLSPAQGAIIELSPKEDCLYPFVTHAFNFVGRGALGILQAGDGDPSN